MKNNGQRQARNAVLRAISRRPLLVGPHPLFIQFITYKNKNKRLVLENKKKTITWTIRGKRTRDRRLNLSWHIYRYNKSLIYKAHASAWSQEIQKSQRAVAVEEAIAEVSSSRSQVASMLKWMAEGEQKFIKSKPNCIKKIRKTCILLIWQAKHANAVLNIFNYHLNVWPTTATLCPRTTRTPHVNMAPHTRSSAHPRQASTSNDQR